MLTKLPLLIVPTVLALVAAIALAAPEPFPPQKPQAVPLMPPLQPYYPKPDGIRSMMPNMTQMPKSHIIAAFAVTAHGQNLFLDTSGKVIGHSGPGAINGVVWLDGPTVVFVPKTNLKAAAPKPKH